MLKALIKDTAIYGLTDFIFRFINFAIFPLLAYVLTVEEFGVYALLTTFALLSATLFNCGLNRSLERFYLDKEEGNPSAVMSMGLLCEALFGLFFIGAGLALVFTFKEALLDHQKIEWAAFALALLGCLPTQLFNLSLNGLRLNFLPWHFTLLNIAQNTISLTLSLYFVIGLRWGVAGFVGGMAIGYSLIAPVAIAILYRRVKWAWDWQLAKKMLAFGYPFVFVDVSRWIYTSLDRWMLAELADTTEVGLYSMAFKLSTLLIFMISAFSLAWTPQALKAHGQDPNHREQYSRCLTLWFFFLSFVAGGISLFGREVFMLLTPPSYWPAGQLLPWVATGLALFGTTYVTMIAMMITKRTHHLTVLAWAAAGINIVLNLWWIPLWGAQGSAAATLVTYCLLSASYLLLAQRLYPIPLEYSRLAMCLALLFGSALLGLYLHKLPWSPVHLIPKFVCLILSLLMAISLMQPARVPNCLIKIY